MDLSLFFAGTSGSVPAAGRGLPATVVRAGGMQLLFDCGEGTQRQLLRSIGLPELDAVFVTHYHLDHWFGLPGLLKTLELRGRTAPMTVYGPPGLRKLFATLNPVVGRIGFPVELVELEPHSDVRRGDLTITAFPVEHRVRAYGYALVEDDRPGRFDPKKAQSLGIRPGPDFGRLQHGEEVDGVRPEQVMGETRRGRRIVFSGDTAPCQSVEVYADGADVLVHEATFLDDDVARARQTAHSTARQAAELARDAGVGMLVLNHLSLRNFWRDVRDQAREAFPAAVVPRDFDGVLVPFPEKGAPEHQRGGEGDPAPGG